MNFLQLLHFFFSVVSISILIYSKNRKTTCEQATAIHENAAIRMLKAQEELDCKPGIYTLWENAFNMSKNVCLSA